MATTPSEVSPSDSLLVLQSLLDGLLQWLAPGQEEGSDPGHLDPLLDESLNQATNARLYGVSALLRIWASAITQRARLQAMFDEDEKALIRDWFTELQRYCAGDLDEHGQRALLDQLAAMPNLAALPDRLHAYLRDRLHETRPYILTLIAAAEPPDDPVFVRDPAGVDAQTHFLSANDDAEPAAAGAHAHHGDDSAFDRGTPPRAGDLDAAPVITEAGAAFVDTAWREAAVSEIASPAPADPAPIGTTSIDAALGDDAVIGDACADRDAATPAADAAFTDAADAGQAIGAAAPFDAWHIGDDAPATAIDAFADTAAPLATPVTSAETIWISPEELQLALDAVAQQILPSVCALGDAGDGEVRDALLGELEFHLGLVGNAMELLGTAALSRGILSMQAAVLAAAPGADDLANWSAALVAFLEQPNDEHAEILAAFSAVVPALDTEWAAALQAETARIRIGLDPRLLAERKTAAEPDDVTLEIAADVLPNVREGMLRELPGNAERIGAAIRRLVATGDTSPIEEARRIAHTLKGDANTVGVRGLANLSHTLEDLLMTLHRQPARLVPRLGRVLDLSADCIEEIADHLLGRGPAPADVLGVYQSLLDWNNALLTDAPEQGEPAHDQEAAPVAAPAPASADLDTEAAQQARSAMLTIPASLLDELQRLAGETLVMARQIGQRLTLLEGMHREQSEEVRTASGLLGKLDDLVSLRGAALQSTALRAGASVDPLELDQYNELHVVSRRLLEANADSSEHQHRLDAWLVELDSLRGQQEAAHADLQRIVQRTRTVPFEQIAGRLQRIVRQTARQLERPVELAMSGTETLLDADLLDRIVEPMGHLLRNAIDHGIEDAAARRAAGKAETGSIRIHVRTAGDSIEIDVADDGRGLDYTAIRSKALALGMVSPDATPSEAELARMILTPGFTTRAEATQVSGRGIGMDVVNQRIQDLRGQLALSSRSGAGLNVRMRLPVSQTMANVIIAHGHGLILGAVAGSVERVHNFSADDLIMADDGRVDVVVDDEPMPFHPIETLYGRGDGRLSVPTASGLGLIVQSARGRRVLVGVGAIGDVSNVIVKPISPLLPPVPSVRGMTLLGDGRLAAVVDMGALIDTLDLQAAQIRLGALSASQAELPRVVVADDSLSVRRALAELMQDAGYEVATARDGLEALELVNRIAPALVLLDLEMPKLNGLEVTRFMRSRAQTRNVPVVMITSRASDRYRVQADEAGVTLMLGKPFSEDELIGSVRRLMAERPAGAETVLETS
jgi:chemotaxis protein histidine kinase CheA/ActR/RegA family two-component response regulator